jgi:N-acetylglucosamine kinase-like BadF-type ATPase
MSMRYVLGVDGGSSKTHALVIDETGRVLGFGKAGAGNHQVHGLKNAMYEVKTAVLEAFDASMVNPSNAELGYYCLAGADLEEDYSMLQTAVDGLGLTPHNVIKNDTLAALRAGLTKPWGVVVICGTGFNAAGLTPDGREFILPGLGAISGDWGGGGELSLEMIRLIMRAWDGRGKPTILTDMVLDVLGSPSIEDLLGKLYREEIDYWDIYTLVPMLFEAAEMGDEVSQELIIRMGEEAGITARAIIHRLGLKDDEVEVVLGGSVFKGKGTLLVDTITQDVLQDVPRACILLPHLEPVVGAAMLALEGAGFPVDSQRKNMIEDTLPDELFISQT